jgi:serine/threonine protein kinase
MTTKIDLPDRYVIDGEIGRGGMGVVCAAHHRVPGQKLAVKVLKEEVASNSVNLKRFKQEATAIAKLNHPNIIRLIDFGVGESGTAFMVTELIEGKSLKQQLEENGPLGADRFYDITMQVCDALIAAHSMNIIHRDIKPSNILMMSDGTARLTDFGIAKIADPNNKDHTLTRTGEIVGTPQYMSPEQAQGQKCDARSDIYSIGCVMYEALTGQPPFDGANPIEVILNHINSQAKPIDNSALSQVVMRCLDKDPDQRYQNVASLKADLQSARSGKQFIAKYRRRHSKRTWLSVVAAGTCVVSAAAFALYQSAPKASDTSWQSLSRQAEALSNQKKFNLSSQTFERAAQAAIRANADPSDIASLYRWAASTAEEAGDDARYMDLAEASCRHVLDDAMALRWLRNAAYKRANAGQYEQARKDYGLLLEQLRKRSGDKKILSAVLTEAATVSFKLKNYEEAEKYGAEAVLLLPPGADDVRAADTYRWYGRAIGLNGHDNASLDRAIEYEDKADAIYESHNLKEQMNWTAGIRSFVEQKRRRK